MLPTLSQEPRMEIALPSGATVTVKDNTVPKDRFAVQDAVDVVVEDGRTVIHGAQSAQWKAFLSRVITAWSFPAPIPSEGGEGVLDEYPTTDDDIDALEDALRERYDRIVRRRPTAQSKASPTSGTSQS
jgi:hypothetical protein